MVRNIFTLTYLVVACVSIVSALPAPAPRHHVTEKSCALPQVATVGSNGISVCSLPSKAPASPILQTLERRAGKKTPEKKKAYKKKVVAKKKAAGIHIPKSRKARAQARVKAGKPKATAKDKGRVPGAPHVKPKKGPISANKKARVDERKENRRLGKLQKQSNVIADAKQKQKMPPYALDANGKFKKIEEKDVAKKAWAKHEKAKTDKATRKADWAKLSTTEQAKRQATKQAAQATSRTAHKTSNIKETNRQKRITTKAAARTQRKNDNRAHAKVAKAEYKNAVGLPTNRKEVYSSPQGKTYTGKDVRQAVFASELAKAKGGVGYNKFTGKTTTVAKDKLPKNFENRPNSDGSHPLHGVPAGPGMIEYPIVHNKQNGHDGRKPTPSDARIVTKKNAAGHTELIGKVGHTTGSNDHKGF